MKKEIENLLKLCVVRESNSPWASPIVAVRKKTGELQLCVDFRKLNEITEKDAFPLPRCDDLLDAAGQGNPRFKTKLDMAQGFHQVPLSEDASKKTVFVMREGHYQYVTMPYGFTCVYCLFTCFPMDHGTLVEGLFHFTTLANKESTIRERPVSSKAAAHDLVPHEFPT